MKRELTLLLAASALALAACGSDDGGISVDGAWARTTPAGTDRGAVYFDITADEADTLTGVSVDPSIAGDAQIHEMVMSDTTDDAMAGDMSDTTDDAMADHDMSADDMSGDDMSGDDTADTPMTMQEMVDGLALPAGETVSFEPGSYHVMLLDLVDPLESGDEFELTLQFEHADDMTVDVEVRDTAP